jgi:hypothetical protein
VVHSRSPSRLTPDASRAPFPQRSPPRLLTAAACGGLRPPPAGRSRRANLHHQHSTTSSGHDLLHRDLHQRSWHTDLHFLGGIRPRQQDQPAEQTNEDEIQQSKRHNPRSCSSQTTPVWRTENPRPRPAAGFSAPTRWRAGPVRARRIQRRHADGRLRRGGRRDGRGPT